MSNVDDREKSAVLYHKIRQLEMDLKIARKDLLESRGWVQLLNGAWVRKEDYQTYARIPNGTHVPQPADPEGLFLDTKSACRICMYQMIQENIASAGPKDGPDR